MTHNPSRPARLLVAVRAITATTFVGGLAVVMAAATSPALAMTSGSPSPVSSGVATESLKAARTNEVPERTTLRIAQANIYTGLKTNKFSQDLANVMAQQPDFITLNEAHHRSDELIVPAGSGYSMWRDTANRYRAETPVAWRSDVWAPLAQGNHMLTNWRGVPKGKKVELGRRFANWVTLSSVDGRVVSVVSVHLAPLTKGMPDLRRPGVESLLTLVSTLSAQGPVLVGGDFNFHYGSKVYPADLFAASGLTPTYETLGTKFPTGDKLGATIDFVFNQGMGQLVATAHRPVELHSDHDAVIADFSWVVDAPVTKQVIRNDPKGKPADRRRATAELRRTLAAAPVRSSVEIFGADLRHRAVYRSVRAAASRGVKVRFITRSPKPTSREKSLKKHFKARSTPKGSVFSTCGSSCRARWRSSDAPSGMILVTLPGAAEASVRLDVNRRLNSSLFKRRTTVVRYTGSLAIAEASGTMPRRRVRR